MAADLVFASEWNTTTGTSDSAIRDTRRARPWTTKGGAANVAGAFEVLNTAAQGRDYPTTNFIRQKAVWTSTWPGGWIDLSFGASDQYIPALSEGDSLYVRYYFRSLYDYQALDDLTHGTEWLNPGHQPYTFSEYHYVGGWRPSIAPYTDGFNEKQYGPGTAGALSKNTTYRIEHGLKRTKGNQFEVYARIYDVKGILLHDTADFDRQAWDNQPTLTLATDKPWTGDSTYWSKLTREFRLGLNGISGLASGNAGGDTFEWAGLAIRAGPHATWCGPYDPAEADWRP